MSFLRFNHIFFALMLGSLLLAFTVPPRVQMQNIYWPVAAPSRGLIGMLTGRFKTKPIDPESPARPRDYDAVVADNQRLQLRAAYLEGQFEIFKARDARLAALGNLRKDVMSCDVVGSEGGSHEALSLAATSLLGINPGAAVLFGEGDVAGKVDRTGPGGSTVRLITDKNFHFLASFATRELKDPRQGPSSAAEYVRLATDSCAVTGVGDNTMVIENLQWDQVQAAKVAQGTWVMLDDPSGWPGPLRWRRVGRVSEPPIKLPSQPLFARVTVKPVAQLAELQDVLVVTKAK